MFTKANFSYGKILTVIGIGLIWLAYGIIFQVEKGLFIGAFVTPIGFLYLLGRWFVDLGAKGKIILGSCVVAVMGIFTFTTINMLNTATTERLAEKGVVWEKHFYSNSVGSIYDLALSSDGDILFVGFADRDDEIGMIYGRISVAGNVIWQRPLSGIGKGNLRSVAALSVGGALLGGYSYDQVRSGLLVRIDEAGNILWSQRYGFGKHTVIKEIVSLTDGNILIAGTDSDEILGAENAYMALLKQDGEVIWEKRFSGDGETSINSVVVTDANEITTAGKIKNKVGITSARFLKISMDGENFRGFRYGATAKGNQSYHSASVLGVDNEGLFIAGGALKQDGQRTYRMAVYDINTDFDDSNVKSYTGPIVGSANINTFYKKDNGNLIMAGNTTQRDNDGNSSATVFEINSEGDLIDSWHMPSHHDTNINDMIVLPSGAQILAGQAPQYGKYRPSMAIVRREPNTGRSKAEIVK